MDSDAPGHQSDQAPGPPGPPPPELAVEGSGPASRRPTFGLAGVLAAVFAVTTLVFAGLWLSARADANDTRAELADVAAVEEAEQAARDARPDLAELAAEHGIARAAIQRSSEESLSLTFKGVGMDGLEDLLADLGFSAAIMDRIGNTRALDGTLTADGDEASASWTYHPKSGLNLVVERSR